MSSDQHYRILGLDRNASSKDVKIIYRKLVKKFHPDTLEPGASPEERKSAEEYFKRIQEAYEAVYSYALERENSQDNEREGSNQTERENRERENQKTWQWEESGIKQKPNHNSNIFYFVVFILGVLLLGYWMITPNDLKSTPSFSPEVTSTPIATASPVTDPKRFTNSIGMEFVYIPSGEFYMGSPSNEVGRYDNEGPVHRVTISKGFYMSKKEVTQEQWREGMGIYLSESRISGPQWYLIQKDNNLPIEQVSWNDAQEFIKKLNEKESTNKYRLPSEAEWEYAARAGTTTRYSFGDDESKLGDYAWYDGNSGGRIQQVGLKNPNPWGLYDMHGNVREWVQDKYQNNYIGAPTDGSSWESGNGSLRVVRGGSWDNHIRCCRSAVRDDINPDAHGHGIGFRLVRDL